MEEIYLKALVARVRNETELLDKLPDEIKEQVLTIINSQQNETL